MKRLTVLTWGSAARVFQRGLLTLPLGERPASNPARAHNRALHEISECLIVWVRTEQWPPASPTALYFLRRRLYVARDFCRLLDRSQKLIGPPIVLIRPGTGREIFLMWTLANLVQTLQWKRAPRATDSLRRSQAS